MKKLLKKYFIAHTDNDYKPHFLREWGILVFVSIMLSLFLVSSLLQHFLNTQSHMMAAVIEAVVVDLTNKDREENDLNYLAMNDILIQAAQLKADDMAQKGYFAHNSPDGHNPWHWFKQAGYVFQFAGENLAVHFSDSHDVERAWMNSPTHRANILNEKFTEIGVATAEGYYEGEKTTFVVQLFGKPANAQFTPIVDKAEPEEIVTVRETEPSVLGEKITAEPGKTITDTTPQIEVLAEDPTFIAVENITPASGEMADTIAGANTTNTSEHNSSWFQKIKTSPRTTFQYILLIGTVLVLISLTGMIITEARKRHLKHIFYGIGMIVLICILFYLTQSGILVPTVIVG